TGLDVAADSVVADVEHAVGVPPVDRGIRVDDGPCRRGDPIDEVRCLLEPEARCVVCDAGHDFVIAGGGLLGVDTHASIVTHDTGSCGARVDFDSWDPHRAVTEAARKSPHFPAVGP